jgi:hypothetical protein
VDDTRRQQPRERREPYRRPEIERHPAYPRVVAQTGNTAPGGLLRAPEPGGQT